MSGKNKKDGNLLSFFHKTSTKNDDIIGTVNSNVIRANTPETSIILNKILDTKNIIDDPGTKMSGPKQPHLQVFTLSTFKKQNEEFPSIYYNKFNWIDYGVKANAVFCFNCRHFSTNTFEEKFDNINGVQNWKKEARNFFNVLEAVYIHFAQPIRNKQLTDLQIKMNITQLTITRLCETRWACRYKNCIAVKNNFTAIIQILEKEIEEDASRDVPQAIA